MHNVKIKVKFKTSHTLLSRTEKLSRREIQIHTYTHTMYIVCNLVNLIYSEILFNRNQRLLFFLKYTRNTDKIISSF